MKETAENKRGYTECMLSSVLPRTDLGTITGSALEYFCACISCCGSPSMEVSLAVRSVWQTS